MSDFGRLRASGAQRNSALCRHYALRVEGVAGFVAYGVLWSIIALVAAASALMGFLATAGTQGVAHLLVFATTFGVVWVPFGFWVRHRLRPARRLFQQGIFINGRVTDVSRETMMIRGRRRDYTLYYVPFTHDGIELEATSSMVRGRVKTR